MNKKSLDEECIQLNLILKNDRLKNKLLFINL